MKILCIADWETGEFTMPDISGLDLILSLGDIDQRELERVSWQVPVFAVHGNHDWLGFPQTVTNLHLKKENFGGYVFAGFEGSWMYKPVGNYLYTEDEVETSLKGFGPSDIFIAHNPPYGPTQIQDMVHNGFRAFTSYIEKENPAYFIHGHTHVNDEAIIGSTRVLSVYGMRYLNLERRD
ncbi:MAG: hypothetical protein GX817_01525 [Elusimicrobia bacterium]|nr:hypothetical protein [Elusimicrobiota bacterium]